MYFFYPKYPNQIVSVLLTCRDWTCSWRPQQEGKGVVLAMGHYGRPIMLSTQLGVLGCKIGMLTQTIDERNPNLNAVERSYLARKMRIVMDAAGGRWLMLDDSMRLLYSGLKSGETIIMMYDLHEANPSSMLELPFCGGTMRLPRGVERVAERTGARVIYGIARDKGRRVEAELRKLPQNPQQALIAAVKELEKDVQAAPWQWWQWPLYDHAWAPPQKDA